MYASEEVRDGLVRLFRHNIMVNLDKNKVRITVKYLRNFGYNDKKMEEIKKSLRSGEKYAKTTNDSFWKGGKT